MYGMMLAVAALGANPAPSAMMIEDRVDLVELNHFYDEQARKVFDQILFYDWNEAHSRYQVADWRLVKYQNQVPTYDWKRRKYVAVWRDAKNRNQLRRTVSDLFRETTTQYDPELIDCTLLPKELRRELARRPNVRLEHVNAHFEYLRKRPRTFYGRLRECSILRRLQN